MLGLAASTAGGSQSCRRPDTSRQRLAFSHEQVRPSLRLCRTASHTACPNSHPVNACRTRRGTWHQRGSAGQHQDCPICAPLTAPPAFPADAGVRWRLCLPNFEGGWTMPTWRAGVRPEQRPSAVGGGLPQQGCTSATGPWVPVLREQRERQWSAGQRQRRLAQWRERRQGAHRLQQRAQPPADEAKPG